MTQPNNVRITYISDTKVDMEFDEALEKLFKSIGYEFVGSGYRFSEEKRDLSFKSVEKR